MRLVSNINLWVIVTQSCDLIVIELEVTCSEIVVSGEIGKKFDADLNGGSIGEIIGG